MFKIIRERLTQGYHTSAYPRVAPKIPDRFRGLPALDPTLCESGCEACAVACPTDAITLREAPLSIDLGRCLFCDDCSRACPTGAIRFTPEYRLAVRKREDFQYTGRELELADALETKTRRLFGRSLKLRQVSAGGCNGCEADTNVLNTLVFDLNRFGVQFVASPRHADGLLITGPVTKNMEYALKQTYEATPAPKIVIAVGACAISGGPYVGHLLSCDGADRILPVDLYVPGCPPSPWTILDGILRLLGRLDGPTAQNRVSPAAIAPTS